MKPIKKILVGLIGFFVIASLLLALTGNSHLFKGVTNTYLVGKSGPGIDDMDIFHSRKITKGIHQPWPESREINQKILDQKYLTEFASYESIAFLVIKKGEIQTELYWDDYNSSSLTNSFSMAKTVVSILIGIAINEGKIKGVNDLVGSYLPAYSSGKNANMTIEHLLTMSSGINFDEDYVSPFAFPAKAYYGTGLKKLVDKYEVTEEPAKIFSYLSGNTQILQQVTEQATGMKMSDYASKKLWGPIGAKNDAFWSLDHENGDEKSYCCIYSNARDFARLGQLYLNKGKWETKQVVSQNYAQQSVVAADLLEKDGTANNRYGYSWWLMDYNNLEIFYARGILGQYIVVIPEKDLVIVRLGHKRSKVPGAKHPADVFMYIDAALSLE
ncbi:MAG: serine hydrolase [Flavobacteriales bacterium]|nr:serine hydrolase [Flavobacteriales bacterium]